MFYVPAIKKMSYNTDFLVERALPKEGQVTVSVGDQVDPSTRLGQCKMVYEFTKLGTKFKAEKKKDGTNYYAQGVLVGSYGRDKFVAPYDGFLEETEEGFVFKAEEKDYWLLPGVWGEVKDVSKNRSVLIKSQCINVHVPVVSGNQLAGELVVFPNPSQMLAEQYFHNFIKSTAGKIVYVGNYLNTVLVEKAHSLGVKVLLAGSASKDAYDFALENDIYLGLFVGFGEINTPEMIYNFINDVTSRYVFYLPEKNTLQIPIPEDNEYAKQGSTTKILKYLRKDMTVQVLNSEHFGKLGTVDRATKSGIFVKLHENNQETEVHPPNLLIIE